MGRAVCIIDQSWSGQVEQHLCFGLQDGPKTFFGFVFSVLDDKMSPGDGCFWSSGDYHGLITVTW